MLNRRSDAPPSPQAVADVQDATAISLLRDSQFREQIKADFVRDAPRDILLSCLLYINLATLLSLLFALNGQGAASAVIYVLLAAGVIMMSALVAWAILIKSSLTRGLFAMALVTVLNDCAIALAMIVDLFATQRSLPHAAPAFVVSVAFVTVPFSARLFTPFVVGKIIIFATCIVYAFLRTDYEIDGVLLMGPVLLFFMLVIAVGYWIFLRSIRQLHLGEALRYIHGIADREFKLRKRMFSYIGHDLRQPINALGYMLFDMEQMSMAKEQGEIVADARACVRSANMMIEDVLQLSHLDAAAPSASLSSVAVQDVLRQVYREYADPARRAGCDFQILPSRLHVQADAQWLARILRNFLSNAIKYAAGTPIRLGVRRRGSLVAIQVIDRGPGMHPQDVDQLFDEFYRISTDRASTKEGFGLGLSIARHLAQSCGGDVQIRSTPGKGTLCEVTLPRVPR